MRITWQLWNLQLPLKIILIRLKKLVQPNRHRKLHCITKTFLHQLFGLLARIPILRSAFLSDSRLRQVVDFPRTKARADARFVCPQKVLLLNRQCEKCYPRCEWKLRIFSSAAPALRIVSAVKIVMLLSLSLLPNLNKLNLNSSNLESSSDRGKKQ
jgi:hypothetical protein